MSSHRTWVLSALVAAAGIIALAAAPARAQLTAYKQTNLVSNGSAPAANTDSNLINPWGVALGPGPFWVANQMSGNATIYDGNGQSFGFVVTVPPATGAGVVEKGPTGTVFNPTSDFALPSSTSP